MPLRWMQFSLRSTPTRGTKSQGSQEAPPARPPFSPSGTGSTAGRRRKRPDVDVTMRAEVLSQRRGQERTSAQQSDGNRGEETDESAVVTRRLDHWDLRGAFGQLCERPNRDGNHLLGDPAYVSAGWTGLRNPLILHPTLELLHLVWRERHGFLPSTGSSRRCFPSSSHPSDAIPHRLRPVGRSPIKPALNKGAISNGIGTRGHWGGSLYRTAGQAPAPRTDRQEC